MTMRPVATLILAATAIACAGEESSDAQAPAADASPAAPPEASALVLEPVRGADLGATFAKQVDVFGVPIVATAATPDDKVLHAAQVMAEYLDNDEDGAVDNALLVETMRAENAMLVMFADFEERDSSGLWGSEVAERYRMQDLEGHETNPEEGFDGAIEEVHHLIAFAGWAEAYPDVFGAEPGTAIAGAMDTARGGHFEQIPDEYPEEAWYHYGDETCDYGCMIIEYHYWAMTTLLGAQSDPARCEWLANEWETCTPEDFVATDTAMAALLTDPRYAMPTVLPDGRYDPR